MKNKTELRIAALRRSGQHGVINWIISQAVQHGQADHFSGGSIVEFAFLNDVVPGTNPFLSCTDSNVLDIPTAIQTPKNMLKLWVQRDWLVYNYEDRPLEAVFSEDFERDHDLFVGPSERRIDIIVLRDAFNFFASRFRLTWMSQQLQAQYTCTNMANLWKTYAREYLGKTQIIKHNKTVINYNRWHTDRDYRFSLAQTLGLTFTDAGFKSVIRRYGGGSSFDSDKYHGQADQMQVLHRWKTMAGDARFRQIFSDTELVELSEEIFGHLEGTENIFSRSSAMSPQINTAASPADGKSGYVEPRLSPASDASIKQELNQGIGHQKAGRLNEAEIIFRRVLDADPNQADALNLSGVNAALRGENQRAVELIGRAIVIDPMVAAYHLNMGNVLYSLGRLDDASASFLSALQIKPDYAEAHNNLGLIMLVRGKIDAAIVACSTALRIRPDFAEAHKNLALALKAQGRLDEALASCNAALKFKPDSAEVHCTLGSLLKEQGRVDAAVEAFRRAIDIKPNFSIGWDNYLYALYFHPGYSAPTIHEEHSRWNKRFADPLKHLIQPHANNRDVERKLKIGYVSPDFRDHVVGRNFLPLLIHHNRELFEITCYSNLKISDAFTQKFHSHSDHWRNITGLSDQETAEVIRSDDIDILVDLALHMADNRLLVFARKPAPVQVTFMGYPGTTGLETIDYRLTDPYLDPPDQNRPYYSEKSVCLPDSFWCYDPQTDQPQVHELPAIKNGFITFGCLNNFCKVNDSVLELWAGALNAVPGSRLMLLPPRSRAVEQVSAKLDRHGIAASRIEFTDFRPREEYLKLYHRIDIGLDTLPYNGHTTSLDGFWMGVPTVTLVGDAAVGRAGWSQLNNLDLKELAARTQEEYVQIIVNLAGDLARLRNIRSTLRKRMACSPLMDAKRFAVNVESAYRKMWRDWCRRDGR